MAKLLQKRWRLFAIVTFLNLIADVLTKWWAKSSLPTDDSKWGTPVAFIENFWDWQLSFNQGSAFGLFHSIGGARIFLSIIGIAALAAVCFMVKSAGPKQRRLVIGLGMVAGGAIGNLIDRIAFGSVTDFVVWKYYDTAWPTFNVADVSLVIGVGIMLLDMRNVPKPEQQGDNDESSSAQSTRRPAKSKSKKRRQK